MHILRLKLGIAVSDFQWVQQLISRRLEKLRFLMLLYGGVAIKTPGSYDDHISFFGFEASLNVA